MKRLLCLALPIVFAAWPAMAAQQASIAVPGFVLWTIERPASLTGHEYESFTAAGHTRYRTVEADIGEEILRQIELPVLTDIFVRELVNSGKLTVVGRSRAAAVIDGVRAGKDGALDGEGFLERARALGVRYLAVGTLTYAAHDIEPRAVAYTSRTDLLERGEIRVELSILDVGTGSIVACVPGKGRIERRIRQDGAEPGPLPGSLFADLREELSRDLAAGTVDALFPFKVASVGGGVVVADRGRSLRIAVGDTFDVIRQGRPVHDPGTGEVIAFEEDRVGRVRVTDVLERACRAEILGDGSGIRPGDILRACGAAASGR